MNDYATMNVSIQPDYAVTQSRMPMPQGLEKVDMPKDVSGIKEYLRAGLAAGIFTLAVLVQTIIINTKLNDLRIRMEYRIEYMGRNMETALYYIVDNLPPEKFPAEKRAEIRQNLERILKQ